MYKKTHIVNHYLNLFHQKPTQKHFLEKNYHETTVNSRKTTQAFAVKKISKTRSTLSPPIHFQLTCPEKR